MVFPFLYVLMRISFLFCASNSGLAQNNFDEKFNLIPFAGCF